MTATAWLVTLYPLFFGLLFLTIWIVNQITSLRSRTFPTRHWLDDRIPFIPHFALIYFSAYLLGNGGYLFLRHSSDFPTILLGYLIIYITSNACYLLFPSRVERREQLAPSSLSTLLISRFQAVSKPFNNFPSMHVSYCLYSALVVIGFTGMAWWSWLLLAWAGVVALSTLLIKQHHLLDVGAGTLLGTTAFLLVWSL